MERVYRGKSVGTAEVRFRPLAGCLPTIPALLLSNSHWLALANRDVEQWITADRCAGMIPVSPIMKRGSGTVTLEGDLLEGLSDPSAAGRIANWKALAALGFSADRETMIRRLESSSAAERRWAIFALENVWEMEPHFAAELAGGFATTSRSPLRAKYLRSARGTVDDVVKGRTAIVEFMSKLPAAEKASFRANGLQMLRHYVEAAMIEEHMPSVAAQLRWPDASLRAEALVSMLAGAMVSECEMPSPSQRSAEKIAERASACAAWWEKAKPIE